MDDTESYLNSILQKRMGSIPNYGAFSKNGNAVTRLPKKQEKVQSMPTVFRKKHQTVYRASQVYNSQNPVLKSSTSLEAVDQYSSQNRQSSNQQRVEYMAISKRIDKKQESNFKAPTVDVSKYRQSTYIPPKQIPPEDLIKKNSLYKEPPRPQKLQNSIRNSQARNSQVSQRISTQGNIQAIQEEEPIQEESTIRRHTDVQQSKGGKRRRIFGASSRQKM